MAATTEERRIYKQEGVQSYRFLEIVANRIIKWGQESTRKATLRRLPFKPPQSRRSLAARSMATVLSWELQQYPGHRIAISQITGRAPSTVDAWLYKNRARPAHQARTLADWIEARIAPMQAAIAELRAYAAERVAEGIRKGNGRYHAALRAAHPRSAELPPD